MKAPTAELLDESHRTKVFSCGVRTLDEWLIGQARRAQVSGTARTWVWSDDAKMVVAYYSIAPMNVRREEVPRSMSGGVSTVPAYLLARLTLDRSLHGQGLGGVLLVDALRRIVGAADSAGGRLVVVDAIDESAVVFYERHDFRRVQGSQRLVMKVATAREALDHHEGEARS